MPAKRHHAVPRFYLKRFTSGDGLIWLHDLKEQTAVQAHPGDALVEKYLYSPGVGDNPKDDSFEQFLAEHVDGPASAAIGRLAGGESLSDQERQKIAVFLAFQEFRVPRMRDLVTRFMSDVGQRILDISVRHPESMKRDLKEMGKPISEEELGRLTQFVQAGGIKVEATNAAWLGVAETAYDIAEMLVELPWTVLVAPSGVEFLTSDSPIVKVLTDRRVPRMYAGGWLSPSAEATFALDPTRVLVVRADGKEGRFGVTRVWCKNVNSRLVSQARRFVVSHSRDSYVEKIAANRAGRRRVKSS